MRFSELLIEKKITAPDGTVYTSIDQLVQDYIEWGYDFDQMVQEIGDQANIIRLAYFARQNSMQGAPSAKAATNQFKDITMSTNAEGETNKAAGYNRYADMTKPERLKLITKVIVQINKNNAALEKLLTGSDEAGVEASPKFIKMKAKLDANLTRLHEYERDMNFQFTGDAVVWTQADDLYPSERSAKSLEREEKIGMKKSENQAKKIASINKVLKTRNFSQTMYALIDAGWIVPKKIIKVNAGAIKEEIVILYSPEEKRYVAIKPKMGKVDTFAMSRAQSNQILKDLKSMDGVSYKVKKAFRDNIPKAIKVLNK